MSELVERFKQVAAAALADSMGSLNVLRSGEDQYARRIDAGENIAEITGLKDIILSQLNPV